MTPDPWDDPSAQEWAEHIRTELVPMITNSAYVMTLVPTGEIDVKFAVELGLSIMLDKPIIAMAPKGRTLPPKLAKIADAVIRYDNTDDVSMSLTISEGIERLRAKGMLR